MAATIHRVRRNDTAPAVQDTLVDYLAAGTDLTGATVQLVLVAATAEVLRANASVQSPVTQGKVKYVLQAADTALSGIFGAHWVVTFPSGGGIESFPNTRQNPMFVWIEP